MKTSEDNVVSLTAWRTRLNYAGNSSRAAEAYALYIKASKLDTSADTIPEAERLYKQAIKLSPDLSLAYTNLGNIRFCLNDLDGAERLYQEALKRDPEQPEALYNMGCNALEREQFEDAKLWFKRTIAVEHTFSDAYFNLARAICRAGDPVSARVYWRKFIALEPTGSFAEYAKHQIAQSESR